MLTKKLLPKEKRRLERYMFYVSRLSRKDSLSDTENFIMRRQMRAIFRVLGTDYSDRVLILSGIDILRDYWPFKERRLRKLING